MNLVKEKKTLLSPMNNGAGLEEKKEHVFIV
jgi:hypothetical protein